MKTYFVLFATIFVALIAPLNAAQPQPGENENIKMTLIRFWSTPGSKNGASTKSIYAFPVSFIEVTPVHTQTHFVFTEKDFDAELKNKVARVGLNARLTQLKIRLINQNLASATYKLFIPRRKVSSRIFKAQTLSMQTLLKKDTSWKIMFSTIPYEM